MVTTPHRALAIARAVRRLRPRECSLPAYRFAAGALGLALYACGSPPSASDAGAPRDPGANRTANAQNGMPVGGNVGGNVGDDIDGKVGSNVGGNVSGNVGGNVSGKVSGNIGGNANGNSPRTGMQAATSTAAGDQTRPHTAARPSASAALDPAVAASAFATRHASYQPARIDDLPGWRTDNIAESWGAFQRSCTVLATRSGWRDPCAASSRVDVGDPDAIRRFFEQYFVAYQIRNLDNSARGVLTGYCEPILNGNRRYGTPYVYPVYGVPQDMLYLDARRLPAGARNTRIAVRVEGRNVVPLAGVSTANLKDVYALELDDSVPDIRDKKIRMRLDNGRVVPYYSRAEIEQGRLRAPVLAYVDDAALLYSMQIQGAGKIRLPDGTVLRLAYAEQNGHAFNPPLASKRSGGRRILVRGVELDIDDGDAAAASDASDASNTSSSASPTADDAPLSPLLRDAAATGVRDDGATSSAADVAGSERHRGFNLARDVSLSTASSAREPRAASSHAAGGGGTKVMSGTNATSATNVMGGMNATSSIGRTSVMGAASGIGGISGIGGAPDSHGASGGASKLPTLGSLIAVSDPSYVFFRPVPDSPAGPVGALGVPLSPGRSVAVDPRTTPLGAPVYVSTSAASEGAHPINRLVIAQDAGGAIRGAVRADYFFGTGPQAQALASRMKEQTQMWVLLPREMKITARDMGIRTRGAPVGASPDCLVGDQEFCVDDDAP